MRNWINLCEATLVEGEQKLGDFITAKVDFPDADFWIVRRSSEKLVGEPKTEYAKECIGVKVTATDVLDPKYLYYMMQHVFNQGYWRGVATGSTNLVGIRVKDVLEVRVG